MQTEAPRRFSIRDRAPGDLGWTLAAHGEGYAALMGFSLDFERYVVAGMADFLARPERSGFWIAESSASPKTRLGAIGMVASPSDPDAVQLRWLWVDAAARGMGVGAGLVERGVRFARAQGFKTVFLWTLAPLLPARRLYERAGFTLAESAPGRMGGVELVEERWTLDLG